MKRLLILLLGAALVGCSLSAAEETTIRIDPATPTVATAVNVVAQIASSTPPPTVTELPPTVAPTQTPPPSPTTAPTEDRNMSAYPDLGPAPELVNTVWLNTDQPLRIADLRGRVVLLEFWTFDCINCIRTIPFIQSWHETYAAQGLVVIGNHYPEFSYERDLQNVRAAIDRLAITYAVAQDNTRATWSAYNQRYWPTAYLIDKWGRIRYKHIGEGRYDETERAIQALLSERYTPGDVAPAGESRAYLVPDVMLNVRSGAGIENNRIGSIDPTMAFVVRDEQNGWYAIDYNDGVGYVSGEYVSIGSQ